MPTRFDPIVRSFVRGFTRRNSVKEFFARQEAFQAARSISRSRDALIPEMGKQGYREGWAQARCVQGKCSLLGDTTQSCGPLCRCWR
jgi:hypothetical protein